MTARRAGRGFTLLEVMVAMAILAVALTVAFEVAAGALQNHVRARQLEVATLLARGKLAEVEAKFDEDGFRDFDQAEDGSFADEGHPEVRWEVKTAKPTVELGADAVLKALTGVDGGLDGLLGLSPSGQGGSGGPSTDAAASLAASPLAQAAKGLIQQQLTTLGEEIKKGVRQVRLTVSWPDGAGTASFSVVTHLVVLTPGSQRPDPAAAGVPGLAPIDPASLPGGLPGGLQGGFPGARSPRGSRRGLGNQAGSDQ